MRGLDAQSRQSILPGLKTGIRASFRVACDSGSGLPARL
jgi:hypothetical protein